MIQGRPPASTSDSSGPNQRPTGATDVLTGLPTREAFCQRVGLGLRRSQTSGESVSVLYVDLDHFKAVNSLHGRAAGDQMLQTVGVRLTHAARGAALVARVGGDEFACLLLGNNDWRPLETMAIAILSTLCEPARIDAFDLVVAPSIGIVMCPAGATDALTILQRAASSMYRARHDKLGYAFDSYHRRSLARPVLQFGCGKPVDE